MALWIIAKRELLILLLLHTRWRGYRVCTPNTCGRLLHEKPSPPTPSTYGHPRGQTCINRLSPVSPPLNKYTITLIICTVLYFCSL